MLFAVSFGTMARPVAAQDTGLVDDTTYIVDLNNEEITWDEPWVFEESLNVIEADTESLGFMSETYIQSILYLPSGIDLEESRDAFLEGFASDDVAIQEVDRGAYDNVSYSLDLAEIDNALLGLFTLYIDRNDYVVSFATLAPAEELGEAVDLAADTIEIEGEPIYDGVEGAGLQDLVDASAEDFKPTDTVRGGADEDEDSRDGDDGSNEDDNADDGSSGDDSTDNGSNDDEDDNGNAGDADAEDYLTAVSDHYDLLSASVARFDEIIGSGSINDANFEELTGILDLWLNAGTEAETLEAPEGYEDLHRIYQEYTWALGEAAVNFLGGLTADSQSAEQTEFFELYESARINADEYAAMLEDLLADEGF
jgi:hypothetical protein